jgi:(2R)-ethylmalonyl-CoA mutase
LLTEEGGIMVVDPAMEQDQIDRLNAWKAGRDDSAVQAALETLRKAAQSGANVMGPSIAAAKAGATTGEWAEQMRQVFGTYRGPTGVSGSVSNRTEGLEDIRAAVDAVSDKLGRRLKFLVGKPGLDGHSNGAEQIAFRARDCGMDIAYDGIRLTPEEIVAAALAEDAHVVGLSILSGSHVPLVQDVMQKMQAAGLGHIPVIVGGIIPEEDAKKLLAMGIAKTYTPKDFELNTIMMDIVSLVDVDGIASE